MGRLRVKATTYRRGGKLVHRRGYATPDKGRKGRTPKGEQWFEPSVESGWRKNMSASERRSLVLQAHGGDILAAARAMNALANVTTDSATKTAARADAKYFYALYRKEGS